MRLRMRLIQKKTILRLALSIVTLTCILGGAHAQAGASARMRYVPNEYIIHVRPGTTQSDVHAMADRLGASVVSALPVKDSYLIKTGRSGAGARVSSVKRRSSAVKWTIDRIQPNYLKYLSYTPDDSRWESLWGMRMINAPAAWDVITGDPSITVAVVDSGVAPHPELRDRLLPGKDFVEPTNLDGQYDANGHGTHVAGTIAAKGNNGIGVAGVCMDDVNILPVRCADEEGGLSSSAIVEGLNYALEQGVDVVNMSFGGFGYTIEEQEVIKQLDEAGVILVAAAGNESINFPHYPSGFPEVISVSALDQKERLAPYSNYGKVDIAAPGGNYDYGYEGGILSTTVEYIDNGGVITPYYSYDSWQGTSMACPHVAGGAALLLSKFVPLGLEKDVAAEMVKERMLSTARAPISAPLDATKYGSGILDLKACLIGGSIKIVKPAKGSSALENSDFKFTFTTINTDTVKVYLDYVDLNEDGTPDNLFDVSSVIVNGANPNDRTYFSADGKTLQFSWPVAAGKHKVYITGDSSNDGTTISDWASFTVSTHVLRAGIHLISFPYVRSSSPMPGSIPANTLPSDLLLEASSGRKVNFMTSGANRAALMRWLPKTSVQRQVPYFTYSEDKPALAKSIAERLAWDNPIDQTWATGGGYSNGDEETFKFPAGTGFWLRLPVDAVIDSSYDFMPADDAFNIRLYRGWNMIGNPFARPTSWGSVLVTYRGEGPKSLMQAEMAGWINPNLFKWSNGGYANVAARDLLEPFSGYWLRANVGSSAEDDQLIITILP